MTDQLACPRRAREVIARVSAISGVSVGLILGRSRLAAVVEARQAAMRAVRRLTPPGVSRSSNPYSLCAIGAWFGRDHTTVMHALRKPLNWIDGEMRRKGRT